MLFQLDMTEMLKLSDRESKMSLSVMLKALIEN